MERPAFAVGCSSGCSWTRYAAGAVGRGGVTSKQLNEQTASWKAKIAVAFEPDKRQMQLKATSDQLREAWNSETTPRGRLEKLRALAACLDERPKLMRVQLFDVQEAAAAIKPITTPGAMAAAPEFWASISGDAGSTTPRTTTWRGETRTALAGDRPGPNLASPQTPAL